MWVVFFFIIVEVVILKIAIAKKLYLRLIVDNRKSLVFTRIEERL